METLGLKATSEGGVTFELQKDGANNLFFVIAGGGLPTLPPLPVLLAEILPFWMFLQKAYSAAYVSTVASAATAMASGVSIGIAKGPSGLSVSLSGAGLPDGLGFPITAPDAVKLISLVEIAAKLAETI